MSSSKTDVLEISGVEEPVIDFAASRGWFYCRKVQWIGRRGAPDRLFIKEGRHVWVEFKRPGKEPDAQQRREHARMRRHGAEVHVIDSVEAGRALFAD